MGMKVRPIRFQAPLLDDVERHLRARGQDLSQFVNTAVDRHLHGDEGTLPTAAGGHSDGVGGPVDLEGRADAYRRALLARDARRARALVEDAVRRGAAVLDVYCAVLRPALEEIGDLWALDEISVVQEHFATEVTGQLLGALAPDRRTAPAGDRVAVVACSPDELHQLGSRMVADVLEREGWEVIALGAAAPAGALAELVAADGPALVALSTATVGRLPGVGQTLGELAALADPPVIAVGGALYHGAVVELARGWGADIVTQDLRELVAEVRERFPHEEH
jgi:methanogenic corrinoid protein MtbC1